MSESLEIFCSAVGDDLVSLALLHHAELDKESLTGLSEIGFPGNLGFSLKGKMAADAHFLLCRAFDEFPKEIDQATLDELAADYAAIYLNNTYGVSPQESVWTDEDGLTMQHSTFQIREWYARFGFSVVDWRKRSDDHLVLQLHFISELLKKGEFEQVKEAIEFMDEHLLRWISNFAERIALRAGTAFYAGLAILTAAYLEELRDLLAKLVDEPRPSLEEIEQRMKQKKSQTDELSAKCAASG